MTRLSGEVYGDRGGTGRPFFLPRLRIAFITASRLRP